MSVLTEDNQYYSLGDYTLYDNTWGVGNLVNDQDFTQQITFDSADVTSGTVMSWNYPDYQGPDFVYAYPEIIWGGQYGGIGPGTTEFANQVDDINNLSVTYNTAISGDTNEFDVGIEIWTTNEPPSEAGAAITSEIMVKVHGWTPDGLSDGLGTDLPDQQLGISGTGSAVEAVHYDSGGAPQHTFVTIDTTSDLLSGTINFAAILKMLVQENVVSGTDYVSGVELGSEMILGSGSLTVNNFSVSETVSTPPPSNLALSSGSDSGIQGDGVTDVTTPTITGTGTAGDTIVLYDGLTEIGTGLVGSGGSWSIVTTMPLSLGTQELTATQTDGSGNVSTPSSPLSLSIVQSPATSDFTGDGMSDVLWQNDNAQDSGSGQTAIWLMDGVTPTATAVVGAPPPSWHVVGTGDFYGTGDADILWQNDSGQAAIWEMNGLNPTAETVFASPPPSWHLVATGDFNGDEMSDVLWQYEDAANLSDPQNGNVAIWEMNGVSAIAAAVVAQPGPDWNVVATGDFNGDGKSDILWQYEDSQNPSDPQNGNVAIWEMNGTTPTVTAVVAQPGPDWHVVGTGDFNGDGKADILWQYEDSQNASDPQNGNVAIWLMNGTTPTAGAVVAQPGSAWHAIGTGDYDGSGRSGILWQNTNGQAAIWLMNGLTPTAESVFASPPSGWQVIPA